MINIEFTHKGGRRKTLSSVNEAARYLSKNTSIEAIVIHYEIPLDLEFMSHSEFRNSLPPKNKFEHTELNVDGFSVLVFACITGVGMRATYNASSIYLEPLCQQLSVILHNMVDERMIIKYALYELIAEIDTDLAMLKGEPIGISQAVPVG